MKNKSVDLEDIVLSRSSESFEARLSTHKLIQEYLKGYIKTQTENNSLPISKKIWVYWAQGKDNMPPIVRACLHQLYLYHDARDVIFLEDSNISDYINIPGYIFHKTFSNKTHFSDVLRVALLAEHGGIWIDSTCFCSSSILPLFDRACETGFFAYSFRDGQEFLLSNWFLASRPGEIIPKLLRDALYYYWQKKDEIEYYFLFHYIFEALYNLNAEFCASWDSVYFLDRDIPHILQGKLSNQFNIIEWKEIMSLSIVHKLTYKYTSHECNGTFLSYILSKRGLMKKENVYNGKVKLNFDFYSGNDQYSDGDIEYEMLAIATECYESHKEPDEVLKNDARWPILYHFSPFRENIIDWFPFTTGASVLEVGSGCGAVTGALCHGTRVTCVELSKKRAMISAFRHGDKENIEIYIGNINDIVFSNKFDYITLIGVLEYAKLYTHTQKPYVDFLNNIRELLTPNGKLIVAIENRYGMKYWAGAREDHTGMLFEGIVGYKNSRDIKTFSKKELQRILDEAGYYNHDFYYPYPDYKMPHVIYSDRRLPQAYELMLNHVNYDQDRISLFDEQAAYEGILENGLFGLFSNSFLVVSNNKKG